MCMIFNKSMRLDSDILLQEREGKGMIGEQLKI